MDKEQILKELEEYLKNVKGLCRHYENRAKTDPTLSEHFNGKASAFLVVGQSLAVKIARWRGQDG